LFLLVVKPASPIFPMGIVTLKPASRVQGDGRLVIVTMRCYSGPVITASAFLIPVENGLSACAEIP